MNMFLAPSKETEERRELKESAEGRRDGGGERGEKEERKREIVGKREMFLMTLEADRKKQQPNYLLQDFFFLLCLSISLRFSLFLFAGL